MGITRYTNTDGVTFYRADFRVKLPSGKTRRAIRKEIPTKEMAQAFISEAKAKAFKGIWFAEKAKPAPTIAELWELYKPTLVNHARGGTTEISKAEHLTRHLGRRRADALSQKTIDAYRKKRGTEVHKRTRKAPAVSTVNREVALLRHLLNWAVRHEHIDDNPLRGVEMLPEDNVRDVTITPAEFDRLVSKAEDDLRPILLFAGDTGQRKEVVLSLRWEYVDLANRVVRLPLSNSSTKKRPTAIPLTDRVVDSLRSLPRSLSGYVFVNPETGTRWNQIQKMFDRARTAAKLQHIRFHDLRRHFVTNAVQAGVPERVVMTISGHRTRSVFDRYHVVREDHLREAIARIDSHRQGEPEGSDDAKSGKDLDRPATGAG